RQERGARGRGQRQEVGGVAAGAAAGGGGLGGRTPARHDMHTPEYIGKYRVDGVLGQGGMGTVYRAFDPAIHRQVAIKTVNKRVLDPVNLQYALMRFRHEAQAVGRLTPPRIPAIYDYGEESHIS